MIARSLVAALAPLTVLGAGLAAPARAADERLVAHLYRADEVVRIEGRPGIQATIMFADDEHVENIAVGDSSTWQITPNKRANLLFIKPLSPRARTNMTVVSDRRTYVFDLVAGPSAAPLYVLRFAYPDEPRTAANAGGLTADESLALAGKLPDGAPDPAKLNFAWKSKGKAALIPARVYDDGQSTYLAWAPRVPIPAIQVRNEAGVEGPINFAVRDDVIVLDGVPGAIVLRSGRDTATLERGTPPAQAPAPPARTLAAAQPAAATPIAAPDGGH